MSSIFNHDMTVQHEDVRIIKDGNKLGMGVSDSVHSDDYPVITTLQDGSPAALSGQLELGDRVKAISNKWCKGKKKSFVHDQVRARPSGDAVLLQIIKASYPWDTDPETSHFDIALIKDREGVGLGFVDATNANDYPRVNRIAADSPAARSEQFNKGDKIKAINNYNMKGKKRQFCYDVVKSMGQTVYFQVIKEFFDPDFSNDKATGQIRKNSVFRVNPLAAMMANMVEDSDAEGSQLDGFDEEEEEDVEMPPPPPKMVRRLSARFESMKFAVPEPDIRRRGSINNY